MRHDYLRSIALAAMSFTLMALAALAANPAQAQVMTIPLPGSQVVLGSLAFNTLLEPSDSNVTVFTNTRTATNSLGATVSTAARVSDFVLTNGGGATCFLQIADLTGNILVAEIAVAPLSTTVINLLNAVPVVTNGAIRIVRSDVFGGACTSRLAITMRGYYTYVN